MKFCAMCGKELLDEAVICPGCGCSTCSNNGIVKGGSGSGLSLAVKIFMVLGTVFSGFYLIPLAWCIPMTIIYFNRKKNNQPIGTAFKICSLLFVNMIAGILMLSDKD